MFTNCQNSQTHVLQILLANLCWPVKSLAKDFCTISFKPSFWLLVQEFGYRDIFGFGNFFHTQLNYKNYIRCLLFYQFYHLPTPIFTHKNTIDLSQKLLKLIVQYKYNHFVSLIELSKSQKILELRPTNKLRNKSLFNSTSCVPRRPSKSVPIYTDNQVALVKATKNNQANPATDEVRVENRNHGLA